MLVQNKYGDLKKIGFYATEKKPKTWQRYADILVPLITLPLLLIIGLYLNSIIADRNNNPDAHQWDVFALCSSLLIISFIVFVYICIRLSAVLGGRTRIRIPMIRSNRSNACFLKSVNSDLQYITPFGERQFTYDSIIFDLPPYDKPEKMKKETSCKSGSCMII